MRHGQFTSDFHFPIFVVLYSVRTTLIKDEALLGIIVPPFLYCVEFTIFFWEVVLVGRTITLKGNGNGNGVD